jgi:hypothetical protein
MFDDDQVVLERPGDGGKSGCVIRLNKASPCIVSDDVLAQDRVVQ